MKTFSLKYTRSRDRQSVYGYILVGFSFMALTLLTVKTLAPEVTTNAAVQTATQKWGNDTMSLSVDDAAAITVTPGESQMTATSGAKNVTINNTCTDGTTLTMKLAGTETALTRSGSDSLRKDIPATANSTGALSDNSWGYSTDGTNYAAVPASTAAGVVLSSSNSTIGATIPVTFGVRVNNSIPSGVYTNDVV